MPGMVRIDHKAVYLLLEPTPIIPNSRDLTSKHFQLQNLLNRIENTQKLQSLSSLTSLYNLSLHSRRIEKLTLIQMGQQESHNTLMILQDQELGHELLIYLV